jgi:alpha-galactosidase
LSPVRTVRLFVCVAALAVGVAAPAQGQMFDNGLAQTPYMGVNTWYAFGTRIDERTIVRLTNAIVARGLRAAGYRYVWIDGRWWSGARGSSGAIAVARRQWPHGMKWLTDYIHANGLLAGIYTDAGKAGCPAHRAGSYGHYQDDVDTFAAWGFDAVKVDFCGGNAMRLDPRVAYPKFAQALGRDTPSRPLLLNICDSAAPDAFGRGHPPWDESAYATYTYGPATANSWRTGLDVGAPGHVTFAAVLRNLDRDATHPEAARPGRWNDPDYLVPDAGMTPSEAQAQFTMWTILAAPLILGDDIVTMPALTQAIVATRRRSQSTRIRSGSRAGGSRGTDTRRSGSGRWRTARARWHC